MRVIDNTAPADTLEAGENHHELSCDIIELLHYKDAHAVLGLRSGAHYDGDAIREAYEANRATIEQSIQKIDESTSSANVGQMNYLTLKLQALDQALSHLSENGLLASRIPEQTRTTLPSSHQRFVLDTEDDDDLDTIDIYFNANRNQAAPLRAKSPSDLSSISGSTIFSFVSEGVRQIKDDISESGLSDLLGPLPEEVPKEKPNAAPSTKPHYKRPPLGKSEPKQRKVKSQVSPTSVVFQQNIHRSLEYDNSTVNPGNQTVGRGKVMERMMRDSRRARAAGEDSNRANIEAARHGIIMAISEDNSECITLDSDFISRGPYTSRTEAAGPVEARRVSRQPITDENPERFFNGKMDREEVETNSILQCTKARQLTVSLPAGSLSSTSKSKLSATSSRGNRKAMRRKTIPSSTSQSSAPAYDGIVTSENDDCDILQAGWDMADELCTALQSCWSNDNKKTPQSHHNTTQDSIDDCTYTDDESTYVHTDGESTAFNTHSSLSLRHQDSPILRNSCNTPYSPADPPPQMYV
ncbi:hypothetical protein THAOC_22472 [Thalassiosira oceanica]|uniref:Uncharacterized protein n=1 Tax=Thalassiosira oceanica TaxID=159749 RepID=K0S975_THAOC|nr:hypothetical protein THAOC_22472 [Thalassiosira oceanica]|eukprot:EJK57476.1 hypothetical protein THAOC_22472 [Thalassiosira oceanica]